MSTSSAAAAHGLVAAFRAGDPLTLPPTAWRLDRTTVADRLDELIADPTLVRQGTLNLCGPAAMFAVWLARDPVAAVAYATTLYESGRSAIGDLPVIASAGLRWLPYGSITPGHGCPEADWMMMAALRDSTNRMLGYRRVGGLAEAAAAITLPAAMRRWLSATGLFTAVQDETNLLLRKGLPHAAALTPGPDQDLLLLVAQEMFRRRESWRKRTRDRVVSLVPNHWILLRSPVEVGTDAVRFSFWSWGGIRQAVLSRAGFERCYYGCLRAIAVPKRYDAPKPGGEAPPARGGKT